MQEIGEINMLKVLIADDDQTTLTCLEKFIHWQDINCELTATALNGAIAHDIAIEKDVDVIITDIKMPVMDGVELCQQLRESNHNAVIIFLSAYSDFHTAQIAMQYQVADYILKPLSQDTIQNLESILIRIQNDTKNKKNYLEQINSREFLEYTRKAMQEGNLLFFSAFFEELKDNDIDFNTIQFICMKMIDLIYEFIYNGVSTSFIERKQNAVSAMISMNSKNAIIDYVHDIYQSIFQHSASNMQKNYDSIVTSIKEYVLAHYCNNLFGVGNVAEHFYFSTIHLNRIFKECTHMTVTDYIEKLRMEKARKLLTETDYNITKISAQVGYSSDNYFIRKFKQIYHITPNEYRRKNAQLQ